MASGDSNASPSYKRRQALRDANTTTIQVLDSNPIDRYYETSLKLLSAFQQAVDERRLDQAYVYGVRFASFSIDSLPRHKHYKLQTNVRSKSRNLKQVDMVLKMMEVVTQRMDAEEMIKEKQRLERAAEEEKMRQIQQEEERKEQEEKARLKKDNDKLKLEKSAMAKLEALGKTLQKSSTEKHQPAPAKVEAPRTKTEPTKATAIPGELESAPTIAGKKQTVKKEKSAKKISNVAPNTVNSSTKQSKSQPLQATNTTKLPSKEVQPRPKSPPPKKKGPLTKEERTIELLCQTIATQEKRLDHIEQVEIPELLKEAKNHLRLQKQNNANQKETRQPQESSNVSKGDRTMKDKHRRAALGCVARKKRLEQQMDVIKAAIFNMETQMFMLETALEDQHVQKAMKEASQVMKELQQTVGMSASELDLTDITASLQLPDGDLMEEEDLLEELEEWLSPQEASKSRISNQFKSSAINDDLADDDVSILSLPTVPDEELTARPVDRKGSSSVQKLLKAVLG